LGGAAVCLELFVGREQRQLGGKAISVRVLA
jgi:hypothetical protein